MDKEILKKVIYDQRNLIKSIDIVERDIKLEPEANYILVGIRRAGKSWLLYKRVRDLIKAGVEWEQIFFINFDDERLNNFTVNNFDEILLVANELTSKKKFFYFDEIQNINGWEKFAKRLADEKYKVDITGSNAKMLSSEMSAKLGGRYIAKEIFPFSFNEFLRAKLYDQNDLSTSNIAKFNNYIDEYLSFGGFPECINFINKREYVSSIYQKVLLGDIIIHNSIRNINGAKLLVEKIAETIKTDVSYSKLHNCISNIGYRLSKDMVIDYCQYCINSFLIFNVKNYFDSFVDKESKPKYYFADNGLLNLFLVNKQTSLLENAVAVQLNRKYKDELYYLKSTKNNIDIDFYLSKQNTVIQVCYELNEQTRNREINQILRYDKGEKHNCNYFIITKNQNEIIEIGNVKINVVSIDKFLL